MLKLFKFISKERAKLFFMILLLLFQVVGTLYIPTLMADIVNKGIMKGNIDQIYQIGGIMIAVAIVTSVISIAGTHLSSHFAAFLGRNIRNHLFSHTQRFSLNDFDKYGAASLITRSTSDVTVIQQTFSYLVEMLLPAPFMIFAGLSLAFSKDKILALVIFITMIIVFVLVIVIGRKTIPYFGVMQKLLDKMNNVLRENITGIRVIRAFNRTKDEKEKEDALFSQYAKKSIAVNKLFAMAIPLVTVMMNICAILIIWIGGTKVAAYSMQIGDIMSIIEYASLTLMYLVMAGMVFIMIPKAQTSAQRINEVLNHVPEFNHKPLVDTEKKDNTPILVFKDVSFRYSGAEEATLENIDFKLYAGETLAIIGSTGSGKSSIAKLILKFHTIQKGEILINGLNVNMIPEKILRDNIGFVPQKAFLFSGTIADNLRHGKCNATFEDMQQACEIAQARDFIEKLDKQYGSPVSQAGNNFSGGQKQRLAIARAIIKKPEIYIFDDSFSALDFKTDAKLRMALSKEVKESAVIIIAQRITTILNADKILVLDEGKAVGLGTHKELLKTCPVYKQIAMSQLSEEELNHES